jgi:uncharacterized protein (TIGR02118 family)
MSPTIHPARLVALGRPLDLDDVGAEIGEEQARRRPRDDVAQLQDAESVERERARFVRAHEVATSCGSGRANATSQKIAMMKSLWLLVRKKGMRHEQFMKHWMEIHTPLALKVPGLRRYVQSHIQGERRRPDIPWLGVEVDGIAETWYADAMAPAIAPPR